MCSKLICFNNYKIKVSKDSILKLMCNNSVTLKRIKIFMVCMLYALYNPVMGWLAG